MARPPFQMPEGFDPMEPWERIDRIREDFKSDSLMHGVPRYQPRYPDDMHEAVHMLGVAIDMLLERLAESEALNQRLWDTVYALFAKLPMRLAGELDPELLELCEHSMHRLTHEQKMMRR